MDEFLAINRWTHIVFGFLGLVAFWIPVFTRKGGAVHRWAGKVFRYSAMVVLAGAGLAVVLHGAASLIAGVGVADQLEGFSFLLFLGYLALVTGVALSHGIAVLGAKRDLTSLNTPYRSFSAWLAIAASGFLIGWALYWRPENAIILYALSPLGISTGIDILRVIRGRKQEPGLWKLEHLGAMLGCGIAFHTAFAVFGSNRLFTFGLDGVWMVLPWVLPAAIGIPATALMTRYYRNRYRRRLERSRAAA